MPLPALSSRSSERPVASSLPRQGCAEQQQAELRQILGGLGGLEGNGCSSTCANVLMIQ